MCMMHVCMYVCAVGLARVRAMMTEMNRRGRGGVMGPALLLSMFPPKCINNVVPTCVHGLCYVALLGGISGPPFSITIIS